MKRTTKVMTALLLLIMLLMPLAFCHAETSSEWTTYQTSNYKAHSLGMEIGATLNFTNLPDLKKFDYIMVQINDANGTEIKKSYSSKQSLLGGSSAIDMAGLSDGKYYIEIYTSPEKYSTYWSYIYQKNLGIYVNGGKASFLIPMVYDNDKRVFNTNRTDTYALSYYKRPSAEIQSESPEIVKLAKEITSGIDSDYEKARAIHDWVANNIWYDWDAFCGKSSYGDTSALGTLKAKKSVCQGYASLTTALLRASDIPTKLVTGYALGVGSDSEWSAETSKTSESNHAWNEVYVDGRWIIVDATWDSNNQFENGVFSTGTGLEGYKHFDATLESFSANHKLLDYDVEIPNWWPVGNKTYYVDNKGNKTVGWKTIDGNRYYFDKNGAMVKGKTLTIAGKKYVFDANGVLKLKM